MSHPKYVEKAQTYWSERLGDVVQTNDLTVFEQDKSVFSGLFSARGVPLFRVAETVKMGFRLEKK